MVLTVADSSGLKLNCSGSRKSQTYQEGSYPMGVMPAWFAKNAGLYESAGYISVEGMNDLRLFLHKACSCLVSNPEVHDDVCGANASGRDGWPLLTDLRQGEAHGA